MYIRLNLEWRCTCLTAVKQNLNVNDVYFTEYILYNCV